jgi:hypothetical protein
VRAGSNQWLAKTVTALALAAAVFAGNVVGARADVGVGSWSPTGAMPQAWAGGSAVTLTGGRVLAVAGDAQGTATDLFDPALGTWTEAPELPVSATDSTLVALTDGGALLVGGAACNPAERRCLPTASVYRLSSTGSAWSLAASMHEARAHPTVVRLTDGRVLVLGGFGDDCPETFAGGYSCQPLASTEIYDPMSGQWSMAASMPQARGGASAIQLSDGAVLVVGGYAGQDAIRYEAAPGSWTTAGQTISLRSASLLFALPGDRALALESGGRAGFFGSLGGAGSAAPPRCNPGSEIFMAATSTWMVSPTEPAGSSYCPNGALLAGGQILLSSILNYFQPGGGLTSPYLLDTEQRCWSTTAPPIVQRDYGTVAALHNGRALVFGGSDANSPASLPRLSSAEIYTPGSPTCTTQPNPQPPGFFRFTGATISHERRLTLTAAGLIRVLVKCRNLPGSFATVSSWFRRRSSRQQARPWPPSLPIRSRSCSLARVHAVTQIRTAISTSSLWSASLRTGTPRWCVSDERSDRSGCRSTSSS